MALLYRILEEPAASEDAEDLQRRRLAQERMLMYLNALRVPPEKSLELALECMVQAGRAGAQRDPLAAGMDCLVDLLKARSIVPATEPDFGATLWRQALSGKRSDENTAADLAWGSLSHPTIRRQSMPKATLELTPWRNVISRWRGWPLKGTVARLCGRASLMVCVFSVVVLLLAVIQ